MRPEAKTAARARRNNLDPLLSWAATPDADRVLSFLRASLFPAKQASWAPHLRVRLPLAISFRAKLHRSNGKVLDLLCVRYEDHLSLDLSSARRCHGPP